MVRTVNGDVSAGDLGVTYMHEHLIIDSPAVADRWPHIHLPSQDDARAELERCANVGVASMIDAMPMASGRGPNRLAAASRASGVNIVMATGLHTDKYYDGLSWIEDASARQLAAWFIADVEEGIDTADHLITDDVDRTSHRAGIVKVATSHDGVTPRAERLFEAAVVTSRATGAAVLTHCEEGQGAMEQVETLSALGMPLGRVVMSHTDKVNDSEYHTDLLEAGVNLEFDQALRQGSSASGGTAALMAMQIERGFVDQLMLGTDGARRSLWSTLGGTPGLAWLAGGYRDILASVGVTQDLQHRMFVDNPARVLAAPSQDPQSRQPRTDSQEEKQ